MPRISEFYGIVIEMYFADHPPPHFHARYAGEEATIVIATGELLAGALAGRALRLVREWLEEHRRELEANWDRARDHQPADFRRAFDMSELIKVHQVEPLEGHVLRISFSDGAVKDVDVSEILGAGGVFAAIRDRREVFEQVRVNPDTRTIEWPGEVDLDPGVLYGHFEPDSGHRMTRRTVRDAAGTHA